MDRGSQWAMVRGIAKKLDMTERQTLPFTFTSDLTVIAMGRGVN